MFFLVFQFWVFSVGFRDWGVYGFVLTGKVCFLLCCCQISISYKSAGKTCVNRALLRIVRIVVVTCGTCRKSLVKSNNACHVSIVLRIPCAVLIVGSRNIKESESQ